MHSQATGPLVSPTAPSDSTTARCPIDHEGLSQRKISRAGAPGGPPLERDGAGVWQVRGFAEARAILRSTDTKQAGFKAEQIGQMSGTMRPPILYLEGKAHQQQRKQTARFFTPRTVSDSYRRLMDTLAAQLIADLQRARRADLSQLSMTLAVRVAAEVVGLTSSRRSGMDKRLAAFFAQSAMTYTSRARTFLSQWTNLARLGMFYLLDVRPAIQARRRAPREDVISHLLAQGYKASEILTECVTYGAAGMVTTREFISVAAWHMLEHPALRARYLAASEAERYDLLEEILRLEPVVGHLYRRATADLHLESQGASITIPRGDLIDLHLDAANTDEAVVGEQPLAVCPGRHLLVDRVPPSVASFGDGHHRCPGSFVAIQESDTFLRRLLALDTLRIERPPTLGWNAVASGYELTDFIIAVD